PVPSRPAPPARDGPGRRRASSSSGCRSNWSLVLAVLLAIVVVRLLCSRCCLGSGGTGAISLDPPFNIALWRTRHRQRPRRNVATEYCSGARVGAVAHREGSDEHGVRPGPDVRSDDRAVLLHPVVVDEDARRSDVGVLADLRVADIGEVGDLRMRPDLRVLRLDEGTELAARAEFGAGAQ